MIPDKLELDAHAFHKMRMVLQEELNLTPDEATILTADLQCYYNAYDGMKKFIERVSIGQFGELKGEFISHVRQQAQTILNELI